jgi:predicted DNA-binding transcriptional regulator YafY
MAITKYPLIRYKILDKCFRNTGKRYFIEDLIKECENVILEMDPDSSGISLRQIREDIAFMKSPEGWSIEIEENRVGRKMYYRYVDPNFSINNMPLNEIEMQHITEAVEILTQFKGMPQFSWLNELVPKLQQGLTQKKDTIIEFDNNEYLKGIDYIGQLYNAIHYKKVLLIEYQPFESDSPLNFTLHPHYLKQYNNRWFLFGLNDENEKEDWNLAIDRIKNISELNNKFKSSRIDWTEYFEDFIGVTKPSEAKSEKIILHFYGKTGSYMETKPIHGSQKSNWISDETLEVKLDLIINYEFERLILSYANNVKVIQPLSLVNQIKERLIEANSLYKK